MTATLTGWSELILALGVFAASHMIPSRPAARQWLVSHMGKIPYLVAYSGLSILVFGWLIVAASHSPYLAIWQPAAWQAWIPNIAMPFVCLLVAYGIAAPNPFSIASLDGANYDPDHPGIVGCTRHPVLWAAALWASAHVAPNGDLAHVIVFCMFAMLGVLGALIVDVRRRKELGAAEWRRLSARTSFLPLAGLVGGRWHPSLRNINLFRLLAAAGLYFGLLAIHEAIIGVSPLPPI